MELECKSLSLADSFFSVNWGEIVQLARKPQSNLVSWPNSLGPY